MHESALRAPSGGGGGRQINSPLQPALQLSRNPRNFSGLATSTMAELWQAARRQVAEYEQRSAELSLALATEKQALEAVEREVKKLDEGALGPAVPSRAVERRRCCSLRPPTLAAPSHLLLPCLPRLPRQSEPR